MILVRLAVETGSVERVLEQVEDAELARRLTRPERRDVALIAGGLAACEPTEIGGLRYEEHDRDEIVDACEAEELVHQEVEPRDRVGTIVEIVRVVLRRIGQRGRQVQEIRKP